jgi:hypothetical protein
MLAVSILKAFEVAIPVVGLALLALWGFGASKFSGKWPPAYRGVVIAFSIIWLAMWAFVGVLVLGAALLLGPLG